MQQGKTGTPMVAHRIYRSRKERRRYAERKRAYMLQFGDEYICTGCGNKIRAQSVSESVVCSKCWSGHFAKV